MNKIGFTNFRRFEKFQPLEYKGITFLVGRNNSGKSTVVKALLLVDHYLKSGEILTFSFGNNILEDVNIVTYGRAQFSGSKREAIDFVFEVDQYRVEISIIGDTDDTTALIDVLLIMDRKNNFNYSFEPMENEVSISKANLFDWELEAEMDSGIEKLSTEIKNLKSKIGSSNLKKTSKEYIFLLEELKSIEKKRDLLAGEKESIKIKNSFLIRSELPESLNLSESILQVINGALFIYEQEYNEVQKGKAPSKEFKDYVGFKEESFKIERSFEEFYKTINSNTLFYLGANPSKQSALFSIRDKNNALAQAINDFNQLRIIPGDKIYLFVQKWMKSMGVGDSFEIYMHGGEAYEVKIISDNKEVHLADKGMGSIQAMLLIFRLASVIHKARVSKTNTTVIIEEPELNLHPQLQSKLADLFLELNQDYHINFIVETHSEYMLRRSQVLVAENEFEVKPNENPFCTYYFPTNSNEPPYRLEYNEHGVFNKNFGEGFFDEASASTLELLKLQRQKKA